MILGTYDSETDGYHRAVLAAASDEVRFLGAIYEPQVVQALRYHSLAYVHGHTVGGTNPSLVEALGAGNPVIAHDNAYNRWVAQDAAVYFGSVDEVASMFDLVINSPDQVARMRIAARSRHAAEFTWERVAGQYEDLLLNVLESRPAVRDAVSSKRMGKA